MKVFVLGGDGFCGWPTSLHLSNLGYDVTILDDSSRRNIDQELGTNSLTPITDIETRIAAWKEKTGKCIGFKNISIGEDYKSLKNILTDIRPEAIVHFAEQRAAPYSMKSDEHKRYTVRRNVNATHDILAAVVDLDLPIHLVHLGTMGVYGYGVLEGEIPEGYIKANISNTSQEIEMLYPTNPGSVYHMTKSLDQLMFQFYAKNDKIQITDLHQGIVWGTQTEETKLDERLINRFDYDGEYGTVLNRFLVQATNQHPLTVYGIGGQKRAFIHIQDTVRCIALALKNPPQRGDKVKIMNQVTEVHRINDLAKMISKITGAPISHIQNPRLEMETNDLEVSSSTLLNLGLQPVKLSQGLIEEVMEICERFSSRCNSNKFASNSYWNKDRKLASKT